MSDLQIEDTLVEYDDQQNPEVSPMEIRTITAAEPLTTEHLKKYEIRQLMILNISSFLKELSTDFQIINTSSLNPADDTGM